MTRLSIKKFTSEEVNITFDPRQSVGEVVACVVQDELQHVTAYSERQGGALDLNKSFSEQRVLNNDVIRLEHKI